MKKEDPKKMTNEELIKKSNNNKGVIMLFVISCFSFIYHIVRDYQMDEKANVFVIILLIALIIGFVIMLPKIKAIREEMKTRNL